MGNDTSGWALISLQKGEGKVRECRGHTTSPVQRRITVK